MNRPENCNIDLELAKEIGKQEALTEELENLADASSDIDQDEAQSWIAAIIKAVISAFK